MNYKSVTESIVDKLREEIVSGRLPAGGKLSEVELAERLGISRPPLREAFRRLENESLVVSVPRKGSYVAEMSVEDCGQINRARMMLECTAVDVLAKRRPARLPVVRRSLAASQAMRMDPGDRGSVVAWFHALSDFHYRLVEASENSWLLHCYQGLRSSLARYQVVYLNLPGAKMDSLEEHERILALLERGDYGTARQELTTHLDKTRVRLLDGMIDDTPRACGDDPGRGGADE